MAPVSSTKENKLAVISFSGGLDSTSLLINLLKNNYNVFALSFDYGQKHKLELIKGKQNISYLKSKKYSIVHKIIDISSCSDLLTSSLTTKNIDVPDGFYEENSMKHTVVPNRNAIFSSIIYGYALTIYKTFKKNIIIALGVHAGDHAIYPDCRQEFYTSIMHAFKIGNWDSDYINLHLPYLKLNKSEILKDALDSCEKLNLDFNTVFKNTLTTYNPNYSGISDGKTGSDIERILAFDSIGLKDPLKYKYSWSKVLENAKLLEKEFLKKKS